MNEIRNVIQLATVRAIEAAVKCDTALFRARLRIAQGYSDGVDGC